MESQQTDLVVNPTEELKKLQKTREQAKLWWKIGAALGSLFLLGIPLPPIPATMATPLMILCFIATSVFFFKANRLPEREALLVARLNQGRISTALLCTELNLEVPTAKALIHMLEKRNLLQLDEKAFSEKNEMVYKVDGLLLPPEGTKSS